MVDRHGEEKAGPGAAAQMALAAAAASGEAREYLRRQSRLTELQIADLEREDKLRHWSLRVRHVSDVLKLAFEFAAAFIVVGLAALLGAIVWSASHDNSLVIEAFSVPPGIAAKGLTGEVFAARLQDRLTAMLAQTDTVRPPSSFHNDWTKNIKVQIPDTGISVGQLYGYLSAWLGDQTHITGEVWHTPAGLTIDARAGAAAIPAVAGSEKELDSLIDQAAEKIYCLTQAYRCAAYLSRIKQPAQSLAVIQALAEKGPQSEKPWAYTLYGLEVLNTKGDARKAERLLKKATELGPNLPLGFYDLAAVDAWLGHDEAAFRHNRRAAQLFPNATPEEMAPDAIATQSAFAAMVVDEAVGDWHSALARIPAIRTLRDYGGGLETLPFIHATDLAHMHDIAASRRIKPDNPRDDVPYAFAAGGDYDLPPLPVLARAVALDDWITVRRDMRAVEKDPQVKSTNIGSLMPVWTGPWLAYADARLGDFAQAEKRIAQTPRDCYLCVRMRANIRAAEKHWAAAGYWFARAAALAPSLPFADHEWGRMLLQKGDADGAAAKFESALRKSPHFADAWEGWGEALIAKNRSDLARAKFEEANRYAPKWGRLHLEWGEALYWSGDKESARREFAKAAQLVLSSADKVELARMKRIA